MCPALTDHTRRDERLLAHRIVPHPTTADHAYGGNADDAWSDADAEGHGMVQYHRQTYGESHLTTTERFLMFTSRKYRVSHGGLASATCSTTHLDAPVGVSRWIYSLQVECGKPTAHPHRRRARG